jgi:hypothetical protein
MKTRDLISLMSCIGKIAFDTYDQAKAVNDRSRHGMNSQHRGFYRCPICRRYHIGHRSPTTKAKKILRKNKQAQSITPDED